MSGFVLSVARAPLGIGLASVPAALPGDTFLFRGLALLLLAFVVARLNRTSVPVVPLLAGVTLGFGLHGLFIGDRFALDGRGELYGLCLLAGLVIAVAYRRQEEPPAPGEEAPPEPSVSLLERAALLLVGAGIVLSLEAVARPLRMLGSATEADDAFLATLFLALTAFGAAAFGPLVPRSLGGAGAAVLLVLTSAACFSALEPLARFSTREGYEPFLRTPPWKLDVTLGHTHAGLFLVAARVLFAPAFVLGTALAAAHARSRLVWTLVGAALGTLALPSMLQLGLDLDDPTSAASSPALRVVKGALLAGVGGTLAALTARGTRLTLRIAAAAVVLALVGVVFTRERPQVLPLSPWEKHPVHVELAVDAVEGVLTVERTPDLGYVVTLDRRILSPSPVELAADEARLVLSWERVAEPLREDEQLRVLLVGQLTPDRARVLTRLGATHIDRTGAWHAHMERIEEFLFEGSERPLGRILDPAELDEFAPWSLVIVPPVHGPVPHIDGQDTSLGPVVAWLATTGAAAEADWGGLVRLAADGVREVSVAVHQPDGIPCGPPAPATTPWSRLSTREFERTAESVGASLRRLADGARGSGYEDLTEGLALHFAAQVRSSPFEEYAQATEIDPEALALLREAGLRRRPDGFVRELWNGLAAILAEKREIELMDEHLEPLAAAWEPWWQLELALTRADLESLDPASAAERMRIVVRERPLDIGLRLLYADALSMAGRPSDAVVQLREADQIQPGRRDIRRRLAIALARSGSADAAPLVAELLAEDPADEELRAFEGPGPYPAVEVGFSPVGMEPLDAHDH